MKPSCSPSLVLTVLTVACLVGTAATQAQYANDANNQVGSGGINTPTQSGFVNSANLYVTGNVSGGAYFRGFSPIRDSSSLFLSLPTARFGDFERETVSVGNITSGRMPWQTNPYFNPSSTATNVSGIQAGVNRPGSPIPATTYQLPSGTLATPYGASSLTAPLNTAYGTQSLPGVVPNSSMYTAENTPQLGVTPSVSQLRMTAQTDLLRQSPIFGKTEIRTQSFVPPASDVTAALRDPYSRSDELDRLRNTAPIQRRPRTLVESALPTSEQMLRSSSGLLSPTELAPKLIAPNTPAEQRDLLTGRPLPEQSPYTAVRQADLLTQSEVPPPPTMISPTATNQYGGETRVFADDAPSSNPLIHLAQAVAWLDELRAAPDYNQRLKELPNLRRQYDDAIAVIHDTSQIAVKTLAGDSEARIDKLLRNAEQQLRQGEYYRAAELYGLAAGTDNQNPLIRLGQAHALLAAGEYMTALLQLERAIDAYPAFGYLRLDLNAFIPDPEALDVRRADLERRLDREENYRLRFLLGYMEYYSGLEKFGLPNLTQASEEAPQGSVIARFPQILDNARNVVSPPPAEQTETP